MELRLNDYSQVVLQDSQNGIEAWRVELDGYLGAMKEFRAYAIDQIFITLAAYSARASEIRAQLVRIENRANTSFRTKEVDPFIAECDRQFKMWSRVVSVQQVEADLTGRM